MNDELAWASATELRALIGARQVSPVEVLEACLDRIEAAEPALHSFITVAAERARHQARQAATAVARNEPLGPLHGVPVALKDEAWTEGITSTGGSLLFGRFRPERDGTVAERLRAAGAVVVGKTNLPEFASWPRSKNRVVPESVNPWDTTRISGASSGGSAACVAAGLVPLAIGSDGGGSIRIPSALCGVVGLYPTAGRVPSYGSFSYSTAGSLGPMARTVEDVALLQQVIAGPDRRDAWALTEPPPDVAAGLEGGVSGLRVGWSPDFGHLRVQAGVGAAVLRAVTVLSELGAVVEPLRHRLDHPWGDARGMAAFQAAVAARRWDDAGAAGDVPDVSGEADWMWSAFAGAVPLTATTHFRDLCRRHGDLLAPHSRLSLEVPEAASDPDEIRRLDGLRRSVREVFAHHDVLCSPTMPVVAPVAPEGWDTPYDDPYMGTNFTFLANATGCTAASVPCGFVDGLPVGLQVIGRSGDEAAVLRVCRAFERATATAHRAPPGAAPQTRSGGGRPPTPPAGGR